MDYLHFERQWMRCAWRAAYYLVRKCCLPVRRTVHECYVCVVRVLNWSGNVFLTPLISLLYVHKSPAAFEPTENEDEKRKHRQTICFPLLAIITHAHTHPHRNKHIYSMVKCTNSHAQISTHPHAVNTYRYSRSRFTWLLIKKCRHPRFLYVLLRHSTTITSFNGAAI